MSSRLRIAVVLVAAAVAVALLIVLRVGGSTERQQTAARASSRAAPSSFARDAGAAVAPPGAVGQPTRARPALPALPSGAPAAGRDDDLEGLDEAATPVELTAPRPDTSSEAWQVLFGRLEEEFAPAVATQLGDMFQAQCRYRRSMRAAKARLLETASNADEHINLSLRFERDHLMDETPLTQVGDIVPAQEDREVVAELLADFHAACD